MLGSLRNTGLRSAKDSLLHLLRLLIKKKNTPAYSLLACHA